MNVEDAALEGRILDLLKATSVLIRPCKLCGEEVYIVALHADKATLRTYSKAGVDHRDDCPKLTDYKMARATQEALLPNADGAGAFDPK